MFSCKQMPRGTPWLRRPTWRTVGFRLIKGAINLRHFGLGGGGLKSMLGNLIWGFSLGRLSTVGWFLPQRGWMEEGWRGGWRWLIEVLSGWFCSTSYRPGVVFIPANVRINQFDFFPVYHFLLASLLMVYVHHIRADPRDSIFWVPFTSKCQRFS